MPAVLGGAITQEVFDPSTGRQFVVSGGLISEFDGTTFTSVPTPGFVSALSAVSGSLVAGFADGSVGLMSEAGTLISRTSTFGDQPSALQALQDGGNVDVFFTQQGSSVPIFVSFFEPTASDVPSSGAVAQLSSPTSGDLVLVVTLVPGGLEEPTGTLDDSNASGGAAFVSFLPPVRVLTPGGTLDDFESTSVLLIVKPDADGGQPSAEFRQRVRDALEERLRDQPIYDSIEDLVETIRDVLKRFGGGPRPVPVVPDVPEMQAQPPDDFDDAVLEGVAMAVQADPPEPRGVVQPAASEDAHWLPDEGESLLCVQAALLAGWICRPPEVDGVRHQSSIRGGRSR